jgi:hypothetical protein
MKEIKGEVKGRQRQRSNSYGSAWIGRFLNSVPLNSIPSRGQRNRGLFKTLSLQWLRGMITMK